MSQTRLIARREYEQAREELRVAEFDLTPEGRDDWYSALSYD